MTAIIEQRYRKIVETLTGEQRGENEYLCICPAHEDRSPSLKVDLRNDRILLRCYAGCSQESVIEALRARDLWEGGGESAAKKLPPGIPLVWPSERMLKINKKEPGPETQRQYCEHWLWRSEDGTIEGITVLYFGRGKKDVIPFFKKWNGRSWKSGFEGDSPRPIYARDKIAANLLDPVWIVEGERKAELLNSVGRLATTWPGGAKSWNKADFTPLRARSVILWPDKDAPGASAMKGLAAYLESIDCKIRVIDVAKVPELGPSDDVVDWFSAGKTAEDLDFLPIFGQSAPEKAKSEEESAEEQESGEVPGKDRPYGEYEEFFIEKLGHARKDIFSGDVMTLDPHEQLWTPIDTEANLSYLYSQALIERKRRLRATSIKHHFLGTYLRSKVKEFIPEIPKWDGTDYVKLFSDACDITNVSKRCFYEYLGQWGALMIARVFNPMIQNQIMILTGEEGGGKSTYIYTLVKGLGQWATNFTVHNQEKDNYEQVASSAVLILDEFERLTKHEQGLIKNLITTPRQRYRPSHERKHQTKMMRASWISTTNLDDILKSSGKNRRFVIFEVERIRWNYPEDASLQLVAQWMQLSEQGYKVSDESRIEMEEYIASKTPAAFWDEVVAELLERVEQQRSTGAGDPSQTNYTNEEMDRIFERIQREYSLRPSRLKKELKDRGFEKRFKRGLKQYRGWQFPLFQDDGDRPSLFNVESDATLLPGPRINDRVISSAEFDDEDFPF
jgi:hypothetical protein